MYRRTEGLDLLKLICAFLVICIHKSFPKPAGRYISIIARMAVPIFFMITGYFSLSRTSDDDGGLPAWAVRGGYHGLLKILKLIFLSNGLYLLHGIFTNLSDGNMTEYLQGIFNVKTLKDLLLFNKSPFGFHLWYLNALLYAMLFIVTLDRLGLRKLLYILTPLLIAGDFILGRYSIFILGRYYPIPYTRNWLLFGVPNICIGMMLREYDVVERTRRFHWPILVAALLFAAGSILDYLLLRPFIKKTVHANYLCTVPASILLFIFFAQIKQFRWNPLHILATLGRETSTGIYIIHVMWMKHIKPVLKPLGLSKLYKTRGAVVLFVVSLLTVLLFNAIRKIAARCRKPYESNS